MRNQRKEHPQRHATNHMEGIGADTKHSELGAEGMHIKRGVLYDLLTQQGRITERQPQGWGYLWMLSCCKDKMRAVRPLRLLPLPPSACFPQVRNAPSKRPCCKAYSNHGRCACRTRIHIGAGWIVLEAPKTPRPPRGSQPREGAEEPPPRGGDRGCAPAAPSINRRGSDQEYWREDKNWACE